MSAQSEAVVQAWLKGWDVSRGTFEGLECLARLVREENQRQNLVSKASADEIWRRHIADSAQLLLYRPSRPASWIDLGTGAGFPGLVVALLHEGPVTLVESRRLRVEFLRRAAAELGISPEILAMRIERAPTRPFEVISARAFAPLGRIFEVGSRFSTGKTVWILPKGQNAQSELEAVKASWQGSFALHESRTEQGAWIIVATDVKRKAGRVSL
jgi:16S rRNA (guanine527-N7)-methyltransferase